MGDIVQLQPPRRTGRRAFARITCGLLLMLGLTIMGFGFAEGLRALGLGR